MYSRANKYKAWHKSQGLCKDCAAKAIPGHDYCEYHRGKNLDRMRKLREVRIVARKCIDCGVPLKGLGLRCLVHRRKHVVSEVLLTVRRKERGECTRCGVSLGEMDMEGMVTCPNCASHTIREEMVFSNSISGGSY